MNLLISNGSMYVVGFQLSRSLGMLYSSSVFHSSWRSSAKHEESWVSVSCVSDVLNDDASAAPVEIDADQVEVLFLGGGCRRRGEQVSPGWRRWWKAVLLDYRACRARCLVAKVRLVVARHRCRAWGRLSENPGAFIGHSWQIAVVRRKRHRKRCQIRLLRYGHGCPVVGLYEDHKLVRPCSLYLSLSLKLPALKLQGPLFRSEVFAEENPRAEKLSSSRVELTLFPYIFDRKNMDSWRGRFALFWFWFYHL